MAIWVAKPNVDRYKNLSLTGSHEDLMEVVRRFRKATSLQESWVPVAVHFYEGDGQFDGDVEATQALPSGDFPWFVASGALVFSEKALDALLPLIQDDVEVLALDSDEGDFSLVHVLEILDCLDLEGSEFDILPSGAISNITRFQFRASCVMDRNIFRIPQQLLSLIFVSDNFKKHVERCDLEGLTFVKVAD